MDQGMSVFVIAGGDLRVVVSAPASISSVQYEGGVTTRNKHCSRGKCRECISNAWVWLHGSAEGESLIYMSEWGKR